MGNIAINEMAAKKWRDDAMEHYVGEVTEDILNVALATTPYDTGYMHDHHYVIRLKRGEFLIFVDTHYSLFVHEGTRHNRPQRWLTHAADVVGQRGHIKGVA